jgi:hypothetical protein
MVTTKRLLAIAAACALITALAIPAIAKSRLAFSGGPEGGTFQYFSNGISTRLSKNLADVEVSNMASAGSVENLRRVNSGDADFGIVYSGDLYLALNGQLQQDTKKYSNALVMSYLYGAPAHLVVLDGSGINKVEDLTGKKVGVGPAGSGAAASAQRYFTKLGLWEKMQPQFIGYNEAVSAMGDKLLDAVWVFAGYPNSSVIQAAASNKIKILDTVEAGKKAGFFAEFPFYAEVTIPAGTYTGVDTPTKTFQDSTLWVAGKHVKADIVYNSLKDIYAADGLEFMVKVSKAAKEMTIADGLKGTVTPVHPGAEKFWGEHNIKADSPK